ncbi:MAG: hypothetical protein R3B90_08380 [Planctomycetaceae bacterium]
MPTPKARSRRNASISRPAAEPPVDPSLGGWKIRQGHAEVRDGVVVTTGNGQTFLGVAAGVSGPAMITARIRGVASQPGKVEWIRPNAQPQSAAWKLMGDDWQELRVEIPVEGPLGILRLYLPADARRLEIDQVELRAAERTRRWEF